MQALTLTIKIAALLVALYGAPVAHIEPWQTTPSDLCAVDRDGTPLCDRQTIGGGRGRTAGRR